MQIQHDRGWRSYLLTLGSEVGLLIWTGGTDAWALGAGMGSAVCAGLVRRAFVVESGVVITMPVKEAEPALVQGCPFTMRTWWMGAADGSEDSFVANITGLWSSCVAAIIGGGGAGAMGTFVGRTGFGLTC